MTEIINGEYVTNELSVNSLGGTEQMARRMLAIDKDLLQGVQIIHSRVRELKPDLKRILVLHDLAHDPEVAQLADPEYRKNFDLFVFVSNWQMQQYNMVLGVPYANSIVIPNGIERFSHLDKDFTKPLKLIYHTTPHRGLELLYSAFDVVSKNHDISLDVYSSFGVYGWFEKDKEFQELFDKLDSHEKINNHGAKSNHEVREALKESHIFAYPSIYQETSCISMIEALCAGNLVIHPNLAALPETGEHGTFMYQFDENINRHVQKFANLLDTLIKRIHSDTNTFENVSHNSAKHYNNVYDWEKQFKPSWESAIRSVKK